MQFRHMHYNSSSSSASSFSAWMAQKEEQANPQHQQTKANGAESAGMFGQLGAIRDSFASQFEGLAGSLPESGPLSAAFRERVTLAIYLLLGSIGFGVLAIFVGLPTLVVRPSKFVLCLSLCTLLAAGSVVVMQTPGSFMRSILNGNLEQKAPVAILVVAQLFTLYVTVFIHKYVYILAAAGLQLLSLLYYLASFIPGGTRGVQLLLRMMYAIVSTALWPAIYLAKTLFLQIVRTIFSS